MPHQEPANGRAALAKRQSTGPRSARASKMPTPSVRTRQARAYAKFGAVSAQPGLTLEPKNASFQGRGYRRGAVVDAQLFEGVQQVGLDSGLADFKLAGDFFIG